MTPSHQPLIAAEGLTRSFGSPRTGDWVEVLRGIDVTIPRGTMLAVVGPSGCGKTSLLYCLSGPPPPRRRPAPGAPRGAGRGRAPPRPPPRLPGLAARGPAAALPAKLSAGQRLRVALARVLYQRPEVVFADEPTGALDSRSSRAVLEVLRGYPGADRSVVMVTHDIAAACMADVVLVMRDGLIRRRLTSPAPGDVLAAAEEAGRNA